MIYDVEPYKKSSQAIKSPLRYPGGKFYALKHIMPYIVCVPHDEYREPFFGGGSVFFAKDKAQYNIINDLMGSETEKDNKENINVSKTDNLENISSVSSKSNKDEHKNGRKRNKTKKYKFQTKNDRK